jgi:hypothetical protein
MDFARILNGLQKLLNIESVKLQNYYLVRFHSLYENRMAGGVRGAPVGYLLTGHLLDVCCELRKQRNCNKDGSRPSDQGF